MKNNRLIAEFMGISNYKQVKYHASWDWLMPVVDKCLSRSAGEWTDIHDALLSCNIQEVYDAVVESIKEYNQN